MSDIKLTWLAFWISAICISLSVGLATNSADSVLLVLGIYAALTSLILSFRL